MSKRGGAAPLAALCLGYFAFYVITGTQVKYYPLFHYGLPKESLPSVHFLVDSTIGSTIVMLLIVSSLRCCQPRHPACF